MSISQDPLALQLALAGNDVPRALPRRPAAPLTGAAIAQFVALRAAACVGADYSNLAIVNVASPGTMRLYHGTFLHPDVAARYVDLPIDQRFPITRAVHDDETIVLDGEDDYRSRFPDVWAETVEVGVRATVSMPLHRNDGSSIGAIGFAWAHAPTFDLKLEQALQALGHLIAEIVQRAEVYEAEHQMIADLHRRLLSELPGVEGLASAARYLPAGKSAAIGGDWYEGIVLDDGTLAVVVGDVVGHGLTAAADMALIRGMITALVHDGVHVEEVFARVSRVLHRRPEDLLATAALAIIDTANSQITYATAGHPPPLLLNSDGTVSVLDNANAPMLGVDATRRVSGSAVFPAGSTLIMYTDGLVESRHRPFYDGIDSWVTFLMGTSPDLSPIGLIDASIADLVIDDPAPDDIAVVAVRRL